MRAEDTGITREVGGNAVGMLPETKNIRNLTIVCMSNLTRTKQLLESA